MKLGDADAALASASESVAVFRHVADADPADFRAQLDLSEALGNLAYIHGHVGNAPAAIDAQTRGLDILKDVRRRDPENRQALRQLATSQARALLKAFPWRALAGPLGSTRRASLAAHLRALLSWQRSLARWPTLRGAPGVG